jgi:hypothetical protein
MSSLQGSAISDGSRAEVFHLSDAGAISRSDIKHDSGLRETFRGLARADLYFLAKAVLGYSDITLRTHYEFCQFIQDLKKKYTLTLFPRGCFKTTIGTVSFCIWYLLNHPDHYILIASQTAGKAERMLLEIERHLEGGNPVMCWLFPEYIKPSSNFRPWNAEMMTVPCRSIISGSPSIAATGVGGRSESPHFHVIINDDLIGAKAMASDREMMEAIAWHDYSTSLFVSPAIGIERAYGTRWDLADLYSVMLKDPKYQYMIRRAIDPSTGELFFPEWLPADVLREIRERNYAYYMSQYMNDPENPEVLDFRSEWLRKYSLIKFNNEPTCEVDGARFFVKDMDLVLVVDPAGSGDIQQRFAVDVKRGRARKSNNAVEVWGLHGSGRYFLLDLWFGRGQGENPELQVATEMLAMARRWKGYLSKGFVEAYGAQRGLITIFNMLARDEGFYFQMKEIPRGMQQAKKVRIRSFLGPPAQNGMIHVRPAHDQFIYEFSKYPQLDIFDTVDAAAWGIAMLQRPASQVEVRLAKQRDSKIRAERLRVVGRAGY